MERLEYEQGCYLLKRRLKQKYTILTDNDLRCYGGKSQTLINNLQQKLGKSRQELVEIIQELALTSDEFVNN